MRRIIIIPAAKSVMTLYCLPVEIPFYCDNSSAKTTSRLSERRLSYNKQETVAVLTVGGNADF